MESRKHQEWRSRQSLDWHAVFTTTVWVGSITYIMSGGSPWSTAGTMNAIVGRDVPWSFLAIMVAHFAVSLFYASIIGASIYRLHLIPALVVAPLVGLVLCVISKEVFNSLGWVMQSPEIRAVITHLSFGLFSAAVYKGASVPPPLAADNEVRAWRQEPS